MEGVATSEIGKTELFVDGAARGNPGHAGVGAIGRDKHSKAVIQEAEYIGETTNNVAEYMALIVGLEAARKLGLQELQIFSDSQLLVESLRGNYKIKKAHLRVLDSRAKTLLASFARIEVARVDREQNADADALANKAIDEFLAGDREMKHIKEIVPDVLF